MDKYRERVEKQNSELREKLALAENYIESLHLTIEGKKEVDFRNNLFFSCLMASEVLGDQRFVRNSGRVAKEFLDKAYSQYETYRRTGHLPLNFHMNSTYRSFVNEFVHIFECEEQPKSEYFRGNIINTQF